MLIINAQKETVKKDKDKKNVGRNSIASRKNYRIGTTGKREREREEGEKKEEHGKGSQGKTNGGNEILSPRKWSVYRSRC